MNSAADTIADGRFEHTFAALDLGTHNCRLLVARPRDQSFYVIDAFSRVVRLGEGLAKNGYLTASAMQRTLEALKICADKVIDNGVTRYRFVATEACRKAQNGDAFLGQVQQQTGLRIETISHSEEAELAAAGCAPLLNENADNAIVFDIGGGSTEISWLHHMPEDADNPVKLKKSISLPLGVVNLAEEYGLSRQQDNDKAGVADYDRLVHHVYQQIQDFAAIEELSLAAHSGAFQLLGTSGTVTTLTALHLGLPRYNRSQVDGRTLSLRAAHRVIQRLKHMNMRERTQHPCIGRERADLVIAGCAVLEAICSIWPAPAITVADRGLREGLLIQLMQAADRQPVGAQGLQ